MSELYLTKLCGVACDVHDRATEAYEWFRHNAGYFDEISDEEKAQVEEKAKAMWEAFHNALTIIDRHMHIIRENESEVPVLDLDNPKVQEYFRESMRKLLEEEDNGGTNADT